VLSNAVAERADQFWGAPSEEILVSVGKRGLALTLAGLAIGLVPAVVALRNELAPFGGRGGGSEVPLLCRFLLISRTISITSRPGRPVECSYEHTNIPSCFT
jgi:hypothetical protein